MKSIISKKQAKNLIIIFAITTIFFGLLPNFVQAKTDTEEGGGILQPIEQFTVYLCDKAMGWLQNTFTTTDPILQEDGTYNFQYSPAIIFSGTVPAFEVNFISPNKDVRNEANYGAYVEAKADDFFKVATALGGNAEYRSKIEDIEENSEYQKESGSNNIDDTRYSYNIYYKVDDGNNLTIKAYFIAYPEDNSYEYYKYETIEVVDDKFLEEMDALVTYESTASILQGTIATWYNTLRRIALVGLLSVLVYVGIRIVFTSSSQDKAKYKGMLKDWLVAICLLFTLHYIMNITLTVTNEISDIFETGASDELLNTLRQDIHEGVSWGEVLAKVIMYVVLVIYTVIFTIQYLKRVIYMAFYTLIAPLITLTYPLDKIKDGQAQAFSMWIKEYVYTSLVQIIHLVIYFVLVGSALSLVSDYPVYAIIVLAFIKKAEDLIKKMFGFADVDTVGTLGAAVTGGLVMNALNTFTQKASKSGKTEGGAKEASNNNVRTVTKDPLASMQANTETTNVRMTKTGTANVANQNSGSQNAESSEQIARVASSHEEEQARLIENINKQKPDLKGGARSLLGRYVLSSDNIKKIGKATLGGLLGGTGAMIGFASGVAQGDMGKALTGIAAGGTAGNAVGKGIINLGSNIGGNVKNKVNDVVDTWNEGAHGVEYAQNVKKIREFKQTSNYKALKKKYENELTDDKIITMLNAGITEPEDMEKVLEQWKLEEEGSSETTNT